MVLGVGDSASRRALAHALGLLRNAGGAIQRDFADEPCIFLLQEAYRGMVLSRRLGGKVLDFDVVSRGPLHLRDGSGTVWDYSGHAVSGKHAGRNFSIMPDSYVSKWSEWSLSHPGAVIAGTSDGLEVSDALNNSGLRMEA